MVRRRVIEEHENHERWFVSFADFMTLLMAFFVVMYSISSVNDGKYKILSETLDGVFNEQNRSIDPIQIGEVIPHYTNQSMDLVATDQGEGQQFTEEPGNTEPLQSNPETQSSGLDILKDQVADNFDDLIDEDMLSVSGNELWVEIEMKSGLLFESGDSIPSNQAFEILKKLGEMLSPYNNPIHVEGFTDNQPINTERFPSNWELSIARAAMIVRMLANYGVDPKQMAAVGYGQYQPIDTNRTEQGRKNNRRVVLVISRNLDIRRSIHPVGVDNATKNKAAFKRNLERLGSNSN